MSLSNDTIIGVIKNICPDAKTNIYRDQLTVTVDQNHLLEVATELCNNNTTLFDMLVDVTAIDWNRKGNRFETVYNLFSNAYKQRLILKVGLEGNSPVCPSLTSIWESANWYERETFDMYGIKFEGHPGLRRFYMPEDFNDPDSGEPLYPLRKDFPLRGLDNSLPLPPYPERDGSLN